MLRHKSISDLPVGRNPEETLRLVQAFRYSDEFGEVCPGKWKPGMRTMVPDVESQKTEKFWEEEHSKVASADQEIDVAEFLSICIHLAEKSGDVIRRIYESGELDEKEKTSKDDPVTIADIQV